RPLGEIGRRSPFAGIGLLAAVGLDASDFHAAVGADDGDAVAFDRNDLAELAGNALGILGWQWLGVKNLQCLTVERGPGAGGRIATADERIDLAPGLAPIDARIGGAAEAFVGRFGFVLFDARRLAGLHEIYRFEHGVDAHREQAVEVDRTERVGVADWRLLLNQYVAGIEAVVGPEDRQACFLLA